MASVERRQVTKSYDGKTTVIHGGVLVPARVVITEPLGAATLVTLQGGDCERVARCSASFHHAPGSALTGCLVPAARHLFDRASGQAL